MTDEPPATPESEPTTFPVAPPSLPSTWIGRFRIRREIAAGGMGTVYEAIQEQPHRIVAVKLMTRGLRSRDALRRFQAEAEILARLHHPGIAQVYEAGTHDDGSGGIPYFAMEYVPKAKTITQYAAVHGLSLHEKLGLFLKVCAAVQHGHDNGIIHRDLKPANILVGEDGEPKVIDFGVARSTDHDLAVTTQHTVTGQVLGTYQYMSPEQIRAQRDEIDERSDVYGLGVVLFELITGTLPYDLEEASLDEKIRRICEEPPARLSTRGTTCRQDLDTLVRAALHKDPRRRYASVAALGRDVQHYLDDEPIDARPDSASYLLQTKFRRAVLHHPVGTAAIIVLLMTVFAGTVGSAFVHVWTDLNDRYMTFATWIARPGVATTPMDRVRVIRITPETLQRGPAIARERFELEDVDPSRLASFRALHGELMTRLASAGPRSVTWNFNFRSETPWDEAFIAGIRALKDAGCPVIVGVPAWPLVDPGRPDLADSIGAHVRWGGASVGADADRPWQLHVFAQRGGGPLRPSLAIATATAADEPDWNVSLALEPMTSEHRLRARYYRSDPANPAPPESHGSTLYALSWVDFDFSGAQLAGLRPGDTIGMLVFDVPTDAVLETATIDYEWALTADDDELRRAVHGRCVVIGGVGPDDKYYDTPDGRRVAGVYAQAVGLQELLSGRLIRFRMGALALPLVALLGVLVAGVARDRRGPGLVLLVAAAAVVVAACVLVFLGYRYVVNPIVPLIALLGAFILAWLVQHWRRTSTA
ncbi:MAG: protein kinase domain-containing protein [Planctomycetota bacterium]